MSGKLLLGPEIGRPHKGDLVINLFVTLGSTINDWGWPKNGHNSMKNCYVLPFYRSERSYLLVFSARDDLVKVS